MSSPVKAPPTDAQRKLADLEHLGVRHVENLDGLHAQDAHRAAEIERLDGELVKASTAVANLPKDATAHQVHSVKSTLIGLELERDLRLEERASLKVQLTEETARQEATAKALKAARAQ